MSKLQELIQQYCPDGVEYKELGQISDITRGGNFQKKDFTEYGFPCIHYGQIYTQYNLFTDKTLTYISDEVAKKQKIAKTNDIIMAVTSENVEDVCKCVVWLGKNPIAVSGHSAIIKHNQNPKYLAYYFHSSMFFAQKRKIAQGTKVIEVSPDKLKKVEIPVPPLEVQAEIVRILDTFTEATKELQTKLEEELTARQKQYEYYRDLLLNFDCSQFVNVERERERERERGEFLSHTLTLIISLKNQQYIGLNFKKLLIFAQVAVIQMKQLKTENILFMFVHKNHY